MKPTSGEAGVLVLGLGMGMDASTRIAPWSRSGAHRFEPRPARDASLGPPEELPVSSVVVEHGHPARPVSLGDVELDVHPAVAVTLLLNENDFGSSLQVLEDR